MIITRTPLRITLGGGSTDLPSYYEKDGGFWIAAAIDKYVYWAANKFIGGDKYIIRYSEKEVVDDSKLIQHPLIKHLVESAGNVPKGTELVCFSDIEGGTGLGSSGSFSVGLAHILHELNGHPIQPHELAEQGFQAISFNPSKPEGKQDPYAAAFGGINTYTVDKTGHVTVTPLRISGKTLQDLQQNLLLFDTKLRRDSSITLLSQDMKTKHGDASMIHNLDDIKKIGLLSKDLLESGQTEQFGKLMHEHWMLKKKRSPNMSTPDIDALYSHALSNGAVGGKLVGAGGGGFLLLYANNSQKLISSMNSVGARQVPFKFSEAGSSVMVRG